MAKAFHSLTTKLVLSFVFLILFSSGLSVLYTFRETKSALKEGLRDNLRSVVTASASQIDGKAVAELQAGQESSPSFLSLRDQLLAMRKDNPDIRYSYIMRKEGDKFVFVVDDSYGKEADAAAIGETYESSTPAQQETDLREMTDGLSRPIAAANISSDQWGSFLSGYAPVKDSSGKAVAIFGVDMTAQHVIDKQNFIGNIIYYIIGGSVALAALIIGFFSLTIIRDIKKLNKVANGISTGDMSAAVDVKRNDEIGELAESFSRMVASLKIMMMNPEEGAAEKPEAK